MPCFFLSRWAAGLTAKNASPPPADALAPHRPDRACRGEPSAYARGPGKPAQAGIIPPCTPSSSRLPPTNRQPVSRASCRPAIRSCGMWWPVSPRAAARRTITASRGWRPWRTRSSCWRSATARISRPATSSAVWWRPWWTVRISAPATTRSWRGTRHRHHGLCPVCPADALSAGHLELHPAVGRRHVLPPVGLPAATACASSG